MPAYVPFTGAKPDLPGNTKGLQPAYFTAPTKLVTTTKPNPLSGQTVTWMGQGVSGAVTRMDKNKFWQDLNKKLGGTLKLQLPPTGSSYAARLATALAGGELTDLVSIYPTSPPRLPEVLDAKFQDLTEYLAGDAINAYPNLANIASTAWQNCVFGGKLYAIPSASPNVGYGLYLNQGIRPNDITPPQELGDGKDLLSFCKDLTNTKKNQWAFGHPNEVFLMYQQMLGLPNRWDVSDGKFTYFIEHPDAKRALELTKQMWDAGYIYPDAYSDKTSSYRLIPQGKNALIFAPAYQPMSGVKVFRPAAPNYGFVLYRLPKYEGGGWSRQHLQNGVLIMNALKKAKKSRIQAVLAAADFIAAPIGSVEWQFITFGVPGWDSEESGGTTVRTKVGDSEMGGMALGQVARPIPPLAPPLTKDDQTKLYDYEKAVLPDALAWPLTGLYSDTDSTTGVALNKNLVSIEDDIITGRKPLSAWDGAVKAWKSGGGDKIRQEYEEAYAQSH